MDTLKLIGLTIIQWIKQACSMPRDIAAAARQRRQRAVLAKSEIERLDRIRNPSNYRGK